LADGGGTDKGRLPAALRVGMPRPLRPAARDALGGLPLCVQFCTDAIVSAIHGVANFRIMEKEDVMINNTITLEMIKAGVDASKVHWADISDCLPGALAAMVKDVYLAMEHESLKDRPAELTERSCSRQIDQLRL
jgi:hypothetical protein